MRRPWILSASIVLWLALSLVAGGVAVAASPAISSQELTVVQTGTSIAVTECPTLTASADTFVVQEGPDFAVGAIPREVAGFFTEQLWVQSHIRDKDDPDRNAPAPSAQPNAAAVSFIHIVVVGQ